MTRFTHVFELAFLLETDHEDASDVTSEMLWEALLERIRILYANGELAEVCGAPWDTYEA